ncbi:MAG: hypothetical protein KatS3mg111_2359 [Pirellulaceae bacterium]|nr:MAG: hypothetical protein KatS3mg111_2359 [Pirellulaceae bacterium]
MWAASPLVIGTSQEILPDVPAAALGLLSAWGFYRWVVEPQWESAILAGLALGLAELSKFTLILLVPVYVGVWLIAWCRRGRGGKRLLSEAAQFTALGLIALVVLGIGYNFQGMFRPLGDYRFYSDKLRGEPGTVQEDNRFRGTLLGAVPMPFPADYVQGIDRQAYDLGHPWHGYLRGEEKEGGWYHYYLYGLVVKEPLAFLGLILWALVFGSWRRMPPEFCCLVIGFPVLVMLCVSLQTNLNHHLRYILPALPFLFLWSGQLVSPEMRRPPVRWLAWALLVMGMVSSAIVYPYSYAYFNWLAGGPENGYRHLIGSNFCWGQDGLLVADLLRDDPEIRVSPGYVSNQYLVKLLEEEGIEVQSFVPMTPEQMRAQKLSDLLEAFPPGDYVISATSLIDPEGRYGLFEKLQPIRIVGYTVHVYRLTERELLDWFQRYGKHREASVQHRHLSHDAE